MIIFLHEGLGSAELWRDFPQRVGDAVGDDELVVYSRRGYGHAPPVELPRPVTYMHDEAAVLRSMGVDGATLVGHSDGASIALLAAGAGMPVQALVLLSPHVFVEDRSIEGIWAAKVAYETGDLRKRLARWHDDVDGAFRGWNDVWLSPAFRSWDITDCLGGVTAPTLLVQEDADAYGTLAQLDAIERGVAGPVERLVLQGEGHAPHLDHPDDVVTAIAAFLAR